MKTYNTSPRLRFDLAALLIVLCIGLFSCSKDDTIAPSPSSVTDEVLLSSERMDAPVTVQGAIPSHLPLNTLIYISHSRCLDACPAYSVTLTSEGMVTFEGISNTSTIGKVNYQIKREVAMELAQYMAMNGFLQLQDLYPITPDASKVMTMLVWNGKTKVVVDYGVQIPHTLVMMRNRVEETLNVNRYVYGLDNPESASPVSNH